MKCSCGEAATMKFEDVLTCFECFKKVVGHLVQRKEATEFIFRVNPAAFRDTPKEAKP